MSRHPNAKPDGFGAHITKNQKATIKESNYINFVIAFKKLIEFLEYFPLKRQILLYEFFNLQDYLQNSLFLHPRFPSDVIIFLHIHSSPFNQARNWVFL